MSYCVFRVLEINGLDGLTQADKQAVIDRFQARVQVPRRKKGGVIPLFRNAFYGVKGP